MRWLVKTEASLQTDDRGRHLTSLKTHCQVEEIGPTMEQHLLSTLRTALANWDGEEISLRVQVMLLEMMFQPSLPESS